MQKVKEEPNLMAAGFWAWEGQGLVLRQVGRLRPDISGRGRLGVLYACVGHPTQETSDGFSAFEKGMRDAND